MKLGEFIRQTRTARGISLRKFAEMAEISPTYMSKIERGEFSPPNAHRIISIAGVLGVNSDLLLAMAGKISPDLPEIILKHPAETSNLLRIMSHWSPEKIIQLTKLIQSQIEAKSALSHQEE